MYNLSFCLHNCHSKRTFTVELNNTMMSLFCQRTNDVRGTATCYSTFISHKLPFFKIVKLLFGSSFIQTTSK